MNSEHFRKLFKDGITLTCSAFRFPHGGKSSVQGFQFYVLKFFLLSKRIFEGLELVYTAICVQALDRLVRLGKPTPYKSDEFLENVRGGGGHFQSKTFHCIFTEIYGKC